MRALGVILAGGTNRKMKELVEKRALAALPIAGGFRAIDFSISNMRNSNIKSVAVLTQYNSHSLNEHLSSSKWWDFGRKQGGLYVFTPMQTTDNAYWYRGTADSIYQNINFLRKSHEPYVVIAYGHGIYKMDYNKVLEYHIAKKADITVVCKEVDGTCDVANYGMVGIDANNRITDFEEKPMASKFSLVSCGIYVIRRRLLIELLENCAEEDRYDIVNDIIIRYKNSKRLFAYTHHSYWAGINDVKSYYRINKDFLKPEVRNFFFNEYPSIYTKVDDNPPAKYNAGSGVRDSLIASGCIINGDVENSILFKKVFIGKNCTIRNSIILNDAYISDNSHIENCIVESRGTIKQGMEYIGNVDNPKIVIEKSERYII